MSISLDDVFDRVEMLSEEKIQIFISIASSSNFSTEQLEQIYLCLEEGLDATVLNNNSLSLYHMEFIRESLKSGNNSENIRYLYTYDKETVERVINFYRNGIDVIPLIELEDSQWYIDLVLECVSNRFDVSILSGKKLSYSNIYNLCNCIILGYDVCSFLNAYEDRLDSVTPRQIIEYFINSDLECNVYLVERVRNLEDGDDLMYSIIAPSEKDAKLISCINGTFDAFSIRCEEFKVNSSNLGIIHSSSIW